MQSMEVSAIMEVILKQGAVSWTSHTHPLSATKNVPAVGLSGRPPDAKSSRHVAVAF